MPSQRAAFVFAVLVLGELIIPKDTNQTLKNLDEMKEGGMFLCLGNSASWPARSGGILIVMTIDFNKLLQVAFDGTTCHMRMYWDTWYDWIKIGAAA